MRAITPHHHQTAAARALDGVDLRNIVLGVLLGVPVVLSFLICTGLIR